MRLIAFKEGVRDSGFSLEGKVDYVKVTFKTQDYIDVIAKVLCLQINLFLKKKRVVQDMIQNLHFRISMFSFQRKEKIWAV